METYLLIIFFLKITNYQEYLIFTLQQMIILCMRLLFVLTLYVLTKKKSKFSINKKKVKNLIKGYENVKKISIKEKKSLNILCRGAAMRYFLTRLYDYTNTPKTALIKIKDPREYYQKLVIHNNLKTYKDYLN